jgi:uncharacterized protein YggE
MAGQARILPLATAIAGLFLGSILGAGIVLAQAPGGSAKAQAAAPTASTPPAGGVDIGAPAVIAPAPNGVASTGAGSAGSSSAIAYPYWGGSPGLAPEHTIVVSGTGQATMRSDGADRASAQKTALAAALADAKGQADAVASITGLTISGVLSVAVSASPYGVVEPMVGSTAPGSGAPVPAPGATGPESQVLVISVTVAYRTA